MHSSLKAEALRLCTLRSTMVHALLLLSCCFGPIILMTFLYDIEYQGPIDAGDLGKCASIFHVLAIVFAGASSATEIRNGSASISFLTQRRRWTSFVARPLVNSGFIAATYAAGMALAVAAAGFYPDGITISAGGWAYLGVYLVIILLWALMAMSLAVLTRSVATAIATPLVWMLLLEQLMSMVPMLEPVLEWMPFTAGMDLLARVLGEPAHIGTVQAVLSLTLPVLALLMAGYFFHTRRDVPG